MSEQLAMAKRLADRELIPISEIANNPARIKVRTRKVDDAGGLVNQVVKFPVGCDPIAVSGTPMREAFEKAHHIVTEWLRQHPHCFPPTIIHITDGEFTDGDPKKK